MATATRRMSPPTSHWLRAWQSGLNGILLCVALALGATGSRRALFLVALVPIAFVPFSYARLRSHRALAGVLARRARLVLAVTVLGALADAVMVVQLLTARSQNTLPVLHGPGIAWIGPVWFSAHALLFLCYVVGGLSRYSLRFAHVALRWIRIAPPNVAPFSPERRQALQQLGVFGVGAPFIVSLSGVQLSYDFRVDEHTVALPHWPRALDGLRIAHLSDIHVGGDMNRERLLWVAALTNEARPDLVVHTGDFLTHRSGDFDAPLYEALARIRAPYGQWASLGNHDFDNPVRLVRRLQEAGVTTLRNRLTTVSVAGQTLELAGLDFVFGRERSDGYARVARTLRPRDGTPRILLNHDPGGFRALPADFADLVCSGHTHGGQVGIQLGPEHALTVLGLFGVPDQGVFRRGDMRLFITRCVGFYGYPLRLGIPPEIAILTLRTA